MGLRVIPIMFLGYLGLAFSLWPNIVPPSGLAMATIDKHQAASTRWYKRIGWLVLSGPVGASLLAKKLRAPRGDSSPRHR
jgi:hypothetical protein